MRNTLDAFPANTAVLNRDGKIIDTNSAWDRFAGENGAATHLQEDNYFIVRDPIRPQDMQSAAAGIRHVISGQQERFYLEYPCHTPSEKRWFKMLVTAFANPHPAV